MSKVTSKRQVTIPRDLADRYGIAPGDEIEWIPSGDEIRVILGSGERSGRLGTAERLEAFDRATRRRDERAAGISTSATPPASRRGWTREELYERGRTR